MSSAFELLSTLQVLIKLGSEIKTRVDSIPRAAEDLQLLDTELRLLVTLFQNPANKDIPLMSEFVIIPHVPESIADLCTKFAMTLDIDLAAGATMATKTGPHGKRFVKRMWALIYSTISAVILHNMATAQQKQMSRGEILKPAHVTQTNVYGNLLHLDLSTGSGNIDQMVGSLIKECQNLRNRLQEAILFPDTSAIQDYQACNSEGASFWRDRFQKDQLNASALRYESLYVSWARFVHDVETCFVLKKIPTGILATGNIDAVHEQGSRYGLDQMGTRRPSTIRPLWLPALRSALDPLHKGYVKPRDFFSLIRDSSLCDTLRRLALQIAGYGILVECERAPGDLPLPATIESPSDHVGWISAQIIAVPTSDELGIVSEREVMEASGDAFFTHFNDISQDFKVYVRYLQTGQIERKSLSKQLRPIGGICVGAALSIRHELESGQHAWSCDLHVTEFKACHGGDDDNNSSSSSLPEVDCALLGPSKVFVDPPKVGEKIQVEHDGFWYDSRVTVVDGDEIEYVDWDTLPKQGATDMPEAQDGEQDDEDGDVFSLSEELLRQFGKGTRRLWRPWQRSIKRYDVRPYRCFHIGDSVEAPVMYPDFRLHYHTLDDSHLYLPARIVDVQGDEYVVEFSPALSAHEWWPGRMPKGTKIDALPGSGVKVENPFDFNRVTLHTDRVRPFVAGPRPVLGIQSAKPAGWSSFQGVHLSNLEDLLERRLWNNDRDSQPTGGQAGGQRDWRMFDGEK
ncbi:uncharacterized protein UV8b_00013 [Ustilaginoidea virens]|uniref:Uncharacterized protein n=1 Tax=Ustilaginoidea virens TaxID=1159556 RepID=A0A8E5MDY7_USTVR|nr:uncharacterized protein UV8b_00013 [Ustilaginoidea virens]QUC15772.1 hypothetical protein UV8b_00013 [Ustilaginoidea virens]